MMSNPPTLFKLYAEVLGGHTHVRVFAGKGTLSLGLAGTLVFRNEEWEDFKAFCNRPGNVEIVLDEEPR